MPFKEKLSNDQKEIDINFDNKISLIETIYWLQKISENEQSVLNKIIRYIKISGVFL
jgi:hypothetical protein